MAVDKERAYIDALYPGKEWKRRVKKMPDAQVIAIYMRAKRDELKPKPKPKPKESSDDHPTLF